MKIQSFNKKIIIIICLLGLFKSCKTFEIADENDYYPKQCPSYKVINEIAKARFDDFYGASYDYAIRGFNWSPELEKVHVFRIEDQKSLQVFIFSEEKNRNSGGGYFFRRKDDFHFDNKTEKRMESWGGELPSLSMIMKETLDVFFEDKQCSIKGIYDKHPDEDIMILEKLDPKGRYSFKFVYKKEERDAIYKVLEEIWNENWVPYFGCLPWNCIKHDIVFEYDPFKKLRK
jgi:hypothetical protein